MIALQTDTTRMQDEEAPGPGGASPAATVGTNGRGSHPGPKGPASTPPYGEMSSWLYNEADRLYTQGHYAESEQRVRQLLELQARAVGTRHADFALGLTMLGELRFLQDDRSIAENLFRQALAIRKDVLGERHP